MPYNFPTSSRNWIERKFALYQRKRHSHQCQMTPGNLFPLKRKQLQIFWYFKKKFTEYKYLETRFVRIKVIKGRAAAKSTLILPNRIRFLLYLPRLSIKQMQYSRNTVGHLAGTQEASFGFPAHISSPAMSSSSLLHRSREQSQLTLSTPFREEKASNICLLT